MKIGILGGSFDPPHIEHWLIAEQVKDILGLDEVWIMPCCHHPLNKHLFSSSQNRYNMVKLMDHNKIRASDFEVKKGDPSYTIETLEALYEKHPNDQFFWIIGSDTLKDFQKWRRWQELVQKYYLVIFPRETFLEHLTEKVLRSLNLKSIPDNITILHSPELILTNLSSTLIRKRVKEGKSIKYLVTKEVEEYIKNNKLYK